MKAQFLISIKYDHISLQKVHTLNNTTRLYLLIRELSFGEMGEYNLLQVSRDTLLTPTGYRDHNNNTHRGKLH